MPFLKNFFCFAAAMLLGILPAYAGDFSIIRDDEIEQSLKIMSKPVFDQAGLSPDAVKFVLVENSALNAFVAGGQNIFLHTGLILETENPMELVGVIAHETGHISAGHLFRGKEDMSNLSVQAMLANLLGIVVAIGGRQADAGIAIGSAGSSILARTFLRHTRTQEGSADQAGVRFLQGSGLPLGGFLSFMQKLSAQELLPESQQSEYVRTHPLTHDRIDALRHALEKSPAGAVPPVWDDLHLRMKEKLRGYLLPDQALQKKGTDVPTQYGHAIAWFRKGQLDKALAVLGPLLEAEPKNPYFHELRGQMMLENGRVEEAIKSYAESVVLAPYSGLIRIAYAHSLLESREQVEPRRAEAIRQLLIAIQKEKQATEPHRLLAIAYGKQGEEGLSRLHLAEAALMQNKLPFAKREAALAKVNLKKGTPSYQRALDILDAAKKNEKESEKKD